MYNTYNKGVDNIVLSIFKNFLRWIGENNLEKSIIRMNCIKKENMLREAGNNADEDTLKNYLNNLGIKEFT